MSEVQWSSDYPGIFIEDQHGMSFKFSTDKALKSIAAKPVGKDLLSLLSKRHQGIGTSAGKKIVITLGQGTLGGNSSMSQTFQGTTGGGTEVRNAARPGTRIRLPGSGKGSNVQYNPNIEHQYTGAATVKTPPFVALAHELIHALHSISGDVTKDYSWNNGTHASSCGAILEEAKTMGLGIFMNMRICENAIRRENGLPLRAFYSSPGDCGNLRR
jgi:hypothetical protein